VTSWAVASDLDRVDTAGPPSGSQDSGGPAGKLLKRMRVTLHDECRRQRTGYQTLWSDGSDPASWPLDGRHLPVGR
jgi:hypothetical protein